MEKSDELDKKMALYRSLSNGYNASAQRLVTSLFGWLAYVAFVSRPEIIKSFNILLIIAIAFTLFIMSLYFWYATCYLGACMRVIERSIGIANIVKKTQGKVSCLFTLFKTIGWHKSESEYEGTTTGEKLTLLVIILLYAIGTLLIVLAFN